MAIPVIDFSNLNSDEEIRAETLALIANACEEWGFFQLVNHGIPLELLERVKQICSEWYKFEREENFFKNSTPVKLLNDVLEGRNTEENYKLMENVDWEDVITLQSDDAEWPFGNQKFKETMMEYRRELKILAGKVMEVMDENLGLPKGYIMKAFNGEEGSEAFFGTKVSHYPPCPHPELVNGLRAHTDAGGVILLFQDDKVGGLQILKNESWVDVQPLENSIVINTGDQIEVLSNGRYKSVWHRILATADGNRRSIASFYNPSLMATIAPAPELLLEKNPSSLTKEEEKDNDHPKKTTAAYPKFVFADYMSVYVKQKFLPKEPRFQAVGAAAI